MSDCSPSYFIKDILSQDTKILYISSIIFFLAVVHTFCTNKILAFSHKFQKGTMQEKMLHLLGEVEIAFGFWALILLVIVSFFYGTNASVEYLNSVSFTEPVFVFVIMAMSATKPIMRLSSKAIFYISKIFSKIFFVPYRIALFNTIFVIGTLSGSFITEPVAMTVSALLLKDHFFVEAKNLKFKYAMLALLFVNISIGGTLTHFAAPPVLMVSKAWNWDMLFMLQTFGIRSFLAITIGTILTSVYFRKDIAIIPALERKIKAKKIPTWIIITNLLFLLLSILNHNHISFLVPLFLLFIAWFEVTKEFQDSLKLRESLMVGFFLGGIVVLCFLQQWWLIPIVSYLNSVSMLFGAAILTAVVDNAALTYLGTLIPNLSSELKYALVAGAVSGGGLTVIANAPNPIGYGILNRYFGADGINPLYLFLFAMPYTVLVLICFLA